MLDAGAAIRAPASARRILMTADAVGGVWQYALELAAGLCGAGCEVWLAVMGPAPTQEQAGDACRIDGLSLRHGNYRLEWMEGAQADLTRAGDWLLGLARDLRPDLVHLNGYAHGVLPWRCPVVVAAHSCVLSWWRAVHGCDAPAEWDWYRTCVGRGLNSADLVVAPTNAYLRTMQALYRFQAPSCVIWNGRTAPKGVVAKKQKAVMTAGRLWDAAKNIGSVAKAASSLQHPVWVAGEEAAARADGADGLVRLGKLGERAMQERLAHALIFVLPVRYEPFGLTALEAAHARCALVLGDIETQRELWDGAAVFVQPDDTNSLARHLQRLLEEPAVAAALGTLARRRARRFTAQRMVKRYLRAYETVIKGQERRRAVVAPVSAAVAGLHSR